MGTINEEHAIQTKVFKNLESYTKDVMEEVSKLKITYKDQCDRFIEELRVLNLQLNEDVEKLTQHCLNQDLTLDDHNNRLKVDDSRIKGLTTRIERAEESILDLKMDVTMLESGKTDVITFRKKVKQLEMKDLEQDIKLFKCTNHCVTLDNYLEKYLPIRTQSQLNDTLRSVLSGKERRRLELYDNEKNSLLYRNLLTDDGSGEIAELMRVLHAKASKEIEESDKRKIRQMAIEEAAQARARNVKAAISGSTSRGNDEPNGTGAKPSSKPQSKHSYGIQGSRPTTLSNVEEADEEEDGR